MNKLCEMMSDYFEDTSPKKTVLRETAMPVTPQVCSWVVYDSPERFHREFTFSSNDQVIAFVSEILRYQREANHSGTQRIDVDTVQVEVYTHDVNRITELDQEYIKHVDFIYRDVLDFGKF